MKIVVWLACMGVCAGMSACESVRRTSAGVALPFAAIGDTLLLPVQGLGAASDCLRARGAEHRARMIEENRGKVTMDASANSALVYELPGFALYPFSAMSPDKLYPMTSACWDMAQAAPASDAVPQREPARTPGDETFEEW